MTGYDAPSPGGYRAIGKHRYGMTVIGLIVLTILVAVVAQYFLGDKVSSALLGMVAAAIWIVQSIRSIVAPQGYADPEIGPSVQSVRRWAIFQLILWIFLGAFWLDDWLHPTTGFLTFGGAS